MEERKELIAPEGKKYVCKHSYSFIAKLIKSSNEVKNQYVEFANEFANYGLKLSSSFNQVRVYAGRKTYALVLYIAETNRDQTTSDAKKSFSGQVVITSGDGNTGVSGVIRAVNNPDEDEEEPTDDPIVDPEGE